jgi:hypothetical protein
MGMRLRLKASYDISSFPPSVQVILTAMKKYGLIMADNGSPMYIGGAPDDRWNNQDLHSLSQVPASEFEVLQMTPLYTQVTLPQGTPPSISSFTAGAATGGRVTLTWAATGASYFVVSPGVGAVRGNTATVPAGATYTLYATSQYGRSSAVVTVP